ncbi:sn-glycerol-3-phosphate dehydrogenase subunit C [Carboxydothermus islandicus]|uniref:sn-glycerol-3-phosphate dehydrogenase subunit C n=1 Tax=Carboxydothermus islandicus TaxID=661089 RepID=A0A1L8D2I8_9THEO|nr:anaerobic glycerol-3-phosphate dehydrogenase subunit C [Carboxydothermus islandicus]GAV25369.1 sn-glycerol-3-phosphate dehydrogenase subunit C [Carboxydothermus islandicus]
MLKDISLETLNHCAKCSTCTANCPVAKVNPDFPGPKAVGPDWLRLSLNAETKVDYPEGIEYCSNCKNCEIACPSGVPVASLNQLTRAEKLKKKGFRLREKLFANPRLLGRIAVNFAGLVNFFTKIKIFRLIGKTLFGISENISFPAYAHKSFSRWFGSYRQKVNKPKNKVVYFPGCFTEYNKPEVGEALVKILNRLNYEVIVPEFKCCGQPAIGNGRLDTAQEFAHFNLSQLKKYVKDGTPVLFSCPSCLLTFKEEYGGLLGIEEAREFVPYFYEAGEFLRGLQEIDKLLECEPIEGKYAYHEPCHLKASGVGTPGLELLNEVAVNKIVPLDAGCCGLSGSYGLKAEKEPITEAIGQNLKKAIDRHAPEALVTECGMCGVQLNNVSGLPVYHPLELLAEKITKES